MRCAPWSMRRGSDPNGDPIQVRGPRGIHHHEGVSGWPWYHRERARRWRSLGAFTPETEDDRLVLV
jgi:hypothetical protein